MASKSKDGEDLWGQSVATQNMFLKAEGGKDIAANERWVKERNASLGGSSGGSSKSSSSNNDADGRDAYTQSAGNAARTAADANATQRYGYDSTASSSRYATSSAASTAKMQDKTERYGIDTTAGTARYGIDKTASAARDTLMEDAKQFEATMAFKMKELANDRDRIAIEQGRAAADKWYQEQQVRLADQTHALALGQLGLEYVKTDTALRSTPGSWAKLADFEAGARARQDVPVYLQNMLSGVQGRAYGAMGGPTENGGAGQVVGALGGGYGTQGPSSTSLQDPLAGVGGLEGWDPQNVSYLRAIAQAAQAGGHKIAPGGWESLSENDREAFLGGVDRIGGSSGSWLESIVKSRPSQGRSLAA